MPATTKFNFFNKQIEAHQVIQQNTIIVYGGAIRGGKSYFMLLELFYLASRYPNSRWLLMRSDMPRFQATTLRVLQELIHLGLSRHIRFWNKETGIIKWFNGSEWILMAESYSSDKELFRFRGLEFNGAGLDEMNELQESTFNKIIERAGSWFHAKPDSNGNPCPIKIIGTCNPANNWVKERFYDKWLNKSLPKKTAYISAKITDNPTVPKEYYDSLRENMTSVQFQRFVEGDWEILDRTGKEWAYAFDYGKHTSEVAFIKKHPVKLSFDFNIEPYTTMLCCQCIRINEVLFFRFFKEYCLKNPDNYPEACCKYFQREYLERFGFTSVDIFGDASGKWGYDSYRGIFNEMAHYLHNLSNKIMRRNPLVTTARDLINEILEEKYKSIRIIIDRQKCPNLIKDLYSLQQSPDGFNPDKVNGIETMGHCYSAMVYLICKELDHLLKENSTRRP